MQSEYDVQTLSQYLNVKAPAAAPLIDWPAIDRMTSETEFWKYANFLFQFAPPLSYEIALRKQFEEVGLTGSGYQWPAINLLPETKKIIIEAGKKARKDIDTGVLQLTSSVGLFGSPEQMKNKYWERALGAKGGLYGNDLEETYYPIIVLDSEGKRLNTGEHNYTMTFKNGKLPPAGAFWSLTLYDGESKLLTSNALNRYLINSTMEKSLVKNSAGDIVLYIQKDSPGKELESNWLPGSASTIHLVMRLYLPKKQVLDGQWHAPEVVRVS